MRAFTGGVKEQVAGLYAQRLAEQGYITVAADAAYQGASTGEPCQTDKPAHRINDVHATVDFLESYPGVDTDVSARLVFAAEAATLLPPRRAISA